MTENIRPTNITVDRKHGKLIIDWTDGHHSEYPLAGLRYICPCVNCRGGHAHMGGPIDPLDLLKQPEGSTEIVHAEMVGGYAIRFQWGDGHDTGIYAWSLLRTACPCDTCLARYEAAD